MAMQYDVKAKYTAIDGVLVNYRARLKSVYFSVETAGGATPINFYDNASSATGTPVFSVGVTGAGGNSVLIPGEGVLFENGIAASLGNSDNLTIFYG